MKNNKYRLLVLLALLNILFYACNNKAEEDKVAPTVKSLDTAVVTQPQPVVETKRPPIINITDTLSKKYLALCIRDSAATYERISLKLAVIYGVKLAAVIKKNNLKITGPPMAWYKTHKAPYFFEAGMPVDKKPGKLPGNLFIKEAGVDSVVVAHFYGSYELLPQAYEALTDWMKDHKKTLKEKPFEIYVDDSMDKDGKLKDPYKVLTDVVFPWK